MIGGWALDTRRRMKATLLDSLTLEWADCAKSLKAEFEHHWQIAYSEVVRTLQRLVDDQSQLDPPNSPPPNLTNAATALQLLRRRLETTIENQSE